MVEETISLSKIIKSINARELINNTKKIELRTIATTIPEIPEEELLEFENVDISQEEALEAAKSNLEKERAEIAVWKEELAQLEKSQKEEVERQYQEAVAAGEKQGYETGYEAGYEAGLQALSAEIVKAQQMIEKSKEDYERRLEKSEPVMIQLAMKVAKKIIGETLDAHDEAWLHLVREAVKEVQGQQEIKIYVHPNWYEQTLHHQAEIEEIALHTGDVYIFPSHDVTENGCFIETPFGRIEASVDSQLLEVKRILLEKLKEGDYNGTA